MVLMIHIAIAFLSLLAAGIALTRPSMKSAKIVAGFTAGTLLSGATLVLMGANLLHLCVSGLVFTSLTTAAIITVVRRVRLAEASDLVRH